MRVSGPETMRTQDEPPSDVSLMSENSEIGFLMSRMRVEFEAQVSKLGQGPSTSKIDFLKTLNYHPCFNRNSVSTPLSSNPRVLE